MSHGLCFFAFIIVFIVFLDECIYEQKKRRGYLDEHDPMRIECFLVFSIPRGQAKH